MMNIRKNYLVFAFAAIFGLTACATQEQKLTEAGASRLNGEQATAHISGNTEKWTKGGGYYHPDGTMETVWEGVEGTGTYVVSDNGEVCTQMEQTYCHFYMNDNGAIIMLYDGKNGGVREMLVGNKLSEL